jgi:hypothetical protein
MIAFISYSISEQERYILTLLAQKLREENFSVTSGYTDSVGFQTQNAIRNASLFIGVITNSDNKISIDKVYSEIGFAEFYNKPSLLLIERSAKVPNSIKHHPNIIIFDRKHPYDAMNNVKLRIKNSKDDKSRNDNTLAWILGGVAALSLISLLSTEKK